MPTSRCGAGARRAATAPPTPLGFAARDHVDLGAPLGLDFELGAELSGSRFTVMKGPIARLHRALAQFMLDLQTREHGYTECYAPDVVNADSMRGTGQLPKFEGDLFAAKKGGQDGDPRPTIGALPDPDQRSAADQLRARRDPGRGAAADPPDRVYALLPLGSGQRRARHARHDPPAPVRQGRDGAGRPSRASYEALEAMTGHAEAMLQALELPYRVMLLCTGDMGFGSAKTYDLEVWLPAQDTYREISSVSNCEAFQARRMQARFKNAQGKNELVHTLNGSGLAVGRTLVAVLENHQKADGSCGCRRRCGPTWAASKCCAAEKCATKCCYNRRLDRHRRGGRVVECT